MGQRKISQTLLVLVVLVVTLCISILHSTIAYADDGATLKVLEQIARSALNTEVTSYLVNHSVDTNTVDKTPYAKGIEDIVAQIRQTVEFNRKMGIKYVSAKTSLEQININVTGDRATLEGIEHTILGLSVDGNNAAGLEEEYEAKHRFSFVREGEQWILLSDEIEWFPPELVDGTDGTTGAPNVFGSLDSGISGDQILDMLNTGDGFTNDLEMEEKSEDPEDRWPDEWNTLPEESNSESHAKPINPENGGSTSPDWWPYRYLAKWRVVSYAYRFALRPNPRYRYYRGNDCTNFASQALKFGGWRRTRHWKPYSWYWNNANYLYRYALYSGRAYRDWNFWHLRPGDIMMVDFNGDGWLDHTVIVTYRNWRGVLFLTYHSRNTRNISLYSFIRRARAQFHRNPWFYPLKMRAWYRYSWWR